MLEAAALGDLFTLSNCTDRLQEPDYSGRTALHFAAAAGQIRVAKYLLENGANPQLSDKWGRRPYDDAKANGHQAICDLLTHIS